MASENDISAIMFVGTVSKIFDFRTVDNIPLKYFLAQKKLLSGISIELKIFK